MSTKQIKALRFSVSLLLVSGLVASFSQGGGATRAEVTLIDVEQNTVTEAVKASGLLGARRSWPVASAAAGTIREILVTNGQQVQKGDVIVRLASEATNRAADQAASLHKSALAQKQMFDAAMSGGAPAQPVTGSSLGVLAAALSDNVNGLEQATSLVMAQAQQPALPSSVQAQLAGISTENVVSFLQVLLSRRGDIQRVSGDLSKSAANVQQLVKSLGTTLNALETGDAQVIMNSVMKLATEASTGLGDIVTFANAIQNMMDLLTLPPAAADEMPTDAISSVLSLLGGQRAGMAGSLGGLGDSLEKVQKSLVQVLGTTVGGFQSSVAAVGNASSSGMSTALATYVEATASMMRSSAEKKAALELRAPEAGLIALGSAGSTGAGTAPDSTGLLGALGGGDEVGGAINSVLGGLSGSSGGGAPQPLISVGGDVAWGQKLFTVYDTSGWSARVTIDEAKISRLVPGMPAVVTVTSLGKAFPATLSWVSPVGTSSGETVTFALEAEFSVAPEEAAVLRIGTKAEVAITLSQVGPAPVMKMGGLTREGNKVKAYVVRDGKTTVKEVKVLASDGVNVAVEGLEVGDQVILAPVDIKDGQAVKAAE
ncbi:MAG: HlyD family efflux transporter periplasmic adaptor subunit [Acidimicrobiales bacterium]